MATRVNSTIAARYAQAVLDSILAETKNTEQVQKAAQEMASLAEIIQKNKELSTVLWSEIFSTEERALVLEDLSKKLGILKQVKRAVIVMSNAGRLCYLAQVAAKLHLLLLHLLNTVPLNVKASYELSQDDRKRVEKKFSSLFGKPVEASYEVDPSLLGGLRVTADGRTYDGSLSGWLKSFEEALVGRST